MAWLDRRTFMLVLAVLVAGIPRTDCSSGEECEELICYPKADMALAGLNASHERLADACGDLGTWMDGTLLGASVYDPTHLEKFREMAMGEKKMVKTPCWQTRSGTWHFRPRQRSFWLLTMVSGRRVQYLRQECCISSKRASEEASADASLCNDDGERVLLVPPGPDAAQRMCLLSRNHQDVIDSVDQIAIKAGTCYEEEGEREEMKTAAFFSWLHSWIEARDLVAFSSKRRRRGLRDAELADGLYAAGFSREICSYEIGMRRRGRGEGRRTDVEDPVKGRSSCRVGDEFELPWEQHHVLQHFMHACDQRLKEHEGAGAGAGAGAAEGQFFRVEIDLIYDVSSISHRGEFRHGFHWIPTSVSSSSPPSASLTALAPAALGAVGRLAGVDLGHGYNIFALLNTSVPSSTDVEVERSTWNFIEEEPRGGWTLADVVGFPFSSDIVMPLFSWRSSRLLPAESPCARKPKAAVIYLVGRGQEFDLESLRASLRALEIHFLRPHSFCYPVFLFREEWDQDLIAMIQTWTAANVEFLVADMSFPANFNPGGRTSVHSKRSAWGYQHMSRFWVRGVFEHAAVRELEMFMRLDTDSFFATPLLDVFQDAQERNISYGYRQAGKDWTGKTRGLWRFHLQYMKDTSSSCLETGQGPGAGAGAGDSKGLLLRLLGYPNISEDADVAMFYTNFELVSVRRFVQEDVWSYVKALDESHGIYLNGWGDAQIRWMQIATFLELRQVHRFCHFAYIHSAAGTKAFDCWQEVHAATAAAAAAPPPPSDNHHQ
ncbi:hypothetical protein GUITHDRAFT_113748 [Guillardia theta CCMP2712]|uniref:Nucleotide-diphospho-sugar transferase domain-containing protein n=2 Tax=Guillardia theta TaxID=55529 RepID=L1IVM1_GUITC|nr:hypothetical protein GUITHDRAFT_113748 [Guillardia theta CCMP2712]EKX40271.1 hypothetical protein GUITHDRAFT_113748 [Guillardia theta CCMP2712]|eukprot:XP_005827251.1 hypothetical protein GUITHDRAFT_113748 [Guillardia theta CCMP2712]